MTKNRNTNLWADIVEVITEPSPKGLMKEQAAYLKAKTKGLLVAEVATYQVDKSLVVSEDFFGYGKLQQNQNNENFIQTFYNVVPTLKYRYILFTVSHTILGFPAEFTYDDDRKLIANNEKEFLDILKQILSSEKTQRILSALLIQARA